MIFVSPCALHLYQDLWIRKGDIASSGYHIDAHTRTDFEDVCVRRYGEQPVVTLRIRYRDNPRHILVEAIDKTLESYYRLWQRLYGSDNYRAHLEVLEKIRTHVRMHYIRGSLKLVS